MNAQLPRESMHRIVVPAVSSRQTFQSGVLGEGAILLAFVHVAEELVVALMEAGDTIDRQRRIDVRVTARFDRIRYTLEKKTRVESQRAFLLPIEPWNCLAKLESPYLPPIIILI